MKTQSKSPLKNVMRMFALVGSLFVTGFVGCGDKSSTNAQRVLPFGTCTNCQNFPSTEIARPSSPSNSAINANYQVLGDSNTFMMISQGYAGNPVYAYQGPLVLRGGITFGYELQQYGCPVPPGQYSVNTIQQGSKVTGGQLTFPALEAVNGQVRVIMSATFYLQSSSGFSNDIVGEGAYTIQSVQYLNGQAQSCNNLMWSTR